MSKEFYQKLAKIQRTLNAPKKEWNSFSKYHYRSCEGILEAVKPLLDGLYLSLSDDIVNVGDRYYVKTTASITDGEHTYSVSAVAREALNKKGMDDSQVTGATSSYARKYCLNGLFGIDDSKDADTDEHKRQITESESMPDDILKSFTEKAMSVKSANELREEVKKIWEKLNGTPQQTEARKVYEIRKAELEAA